MNTNQHANDPKTSNEMDKSDESRVADIDVDEAAKVTGGGLIVREEGDDRVPNSAPPHGI